LRKCTYDEEVEIIDLVIGELTKLTQMNAHERYMEIHKNLLKESQTSYILWRLVSSEEKTEELKLQILKGLKIDFRKYGYRALKAALDESKDKEQIAKWLLYKTQWDPQTRTCHPIGQREIELLSSIVQYYPQEVRTLSSLIAEAQKEYSIKLLMFSDQIIRNLIANQQVPSLETLVLLEDAEVGKLGTVLEDIRMIGESYAENKEQGYRIMAATAYLENLIRLKTDATDHE